MEIFVLVIILVVAFVIYRIRSVKKSIRNQGDDLLNYAIELRRNAAIEILKNHSFFLGAYGLYQSKFSNEGILKIFYSSQNVIVEKLRKHNQLLNNEEQTLQIRSLSIEFTSLYDFTSDPNLPLKLINKRLEELVTLGFENLSPFVPPKD